MLDISRWLICFTAAGHGPHTRRTDAAKQRTVAYLSGRGHWGQMFLLWVLITSYTTPSARQCKCGRFSLPPYSKQERSLFTAALEQTSDVPTARDVGQSSGRVRRRAWLVSRTRNGVRSTIATSPLPSPLRCVSILTHASCAGDTVAARR